MRADKTTHVLPPIEEYEQLVIANMAQEAAAQIEAGDHDLVDADQFFRELAGERIAKARKAAGLTQAQLGRKLGIPQSQVSRIERRPDHTTVKTIKRIAKALKVDVRALL
ncbi:MAG TPA: helix-turn-helix transcriptional regulator [Phycisphaerae bacterium]|nr:helix-turn-helix transcriptional regulator [Phycisphaerae bacterium]